MDNKWLACSLPNSKHFNTEAQKNLICNIFHDTQAFLDKTSQMGKLLLGHGL